MGNKGGATTTTTQNQTYTPTGGNYINNALQQGQAAASLPFNVPQAPVAGFSQDQQNAFNTVNNSQGMAQPYYNTAASYYSPQGAQAFFNPYAANVMSGLQDVFGEQNTQNTGNLTQAAGGVGADRIAVGQADLAKQQGLAAGQTLAGLYGTSVNQAQTAGQNTANLGTAAQNAAFSGAQQQLGTGGLQQQLSQAQLNSPYQLALAQAAFPYQQAQFNAGITGSLAPGLGGNTSGTGTSTAPAPSLLSQILGLGTAGVGAAGAFGAFSPTSGSNPFGSSPSYGGGNFYTGDAYGGSGSSPLPGLSASDYASTGGRIDPYADGGKVYAPPARPYPIVPKPAGNDNMAPRFSGRGPAGANDNGEKYDGGGSVASPTSVYSLPSGFNDKPINVDQSSIIPTGQLPQVQAHIPQLNLTPAPAQQSNPMGDVANIAKMAMMFAARGGRIDPKKFDGYNPYAFADGGDTSSIEDRFDPVKDAIASGDFDPMGSNSTTFEGRPAMSGANSRAIPLPRARPAGASALAADPDDNATDALSFTGQPDATGLPPEIASGASANAYASAPAAADASSQGVSTASAPSATKREPGLSDNPWMALVQAGLGIAGGTSPYAGVNIGQGAMQGLKTLQAQRESAQKDETIDQATRRLDQEAKFHEDQYKRLTMGQKQTAEQADRPYKELTAAQQATLDKEKYAPAGSIMTKDGLHPAFYEATTGKVIDGITGNAPEVGDHVIPKNGSKNTPEEIASVVQGIKDGSQPPTLTGLYGDSVHVRAGLQKDGFDLGKAQLEWKAAQAQTAAVNSSRMTQYVGLNKSVDRTIDEVKQLAEQMQQGGIPFVNRLQLAKYIQAEGNSEKGQLATQYMTAVNTLKEEFANLANGGYAPTEAAWKLANEQVNGNFGIKQMHASLDEIQRLIRYRLQAVPNLATMGPASANRYNGQGGGDGGGAKPDVQTRFGQLIGGGKSEEETYKILHEEGYR